MRLQNLFGAPLPIQILEFMRSNSLDGGADNSPFRRGKATVYEGGVRVPALVSWPGTLAPRQLKSIVTVEDILPTLADLVGFSAAAGSPFDGASQWGAIRDGAPSPHPNYFTQGRKGEAWYEFPWKLILPPDKEPELYRLDLDPTETTNLATSEPERLEQLLAGHAAYPRGRSIHIPFYQFAWDPDLFGGVEDREPWADRAARLAAQRSAEEKQ
jgi:arylsulfatase A-like enzyme